MSEIQDIEVRKMELQDEIKSVIEKFMDETGKGVKNIYINAFEGVAGDDGFDFSVLVELNT